MLENEGFRYEKYIDIFDGGPTMTARLDEVRTIRDARLTNVERIADGGEQALVATGQLRDFRCAFGQVDGGALDPACAAALKVGVGDTISVVSRA